MNWTLRKIAFLVAVLCAAVTGLGACNSTPTTPAGTPTDRTGPLNVALTAMTNGHQYRLRRAPFPIVGPSQVTLSSESAPDAPALTAELEVGSYTSELGGPWFLERLDPNGPVRVNATLA